MKVDPMVPDDPIRNAPVVAPPTATDTPAVTQTSAVQAYSQTAMPGGSDRASVSKTASDLSAALRSMPKDAGASPERLTQLRGALRTGAMAVDIVALADAILRDEGTKP